MQSEGKGMNGFDKNIRFVSQNSKALKYKQGIS